MEKERYLIQLLDVIRVLRGPESDVARKHLQAYESNHTVNRRKMFQLYKYIKINKIQSFDKLKKKISPDSTEDSFNKLIRRTTERVQESLIIDVNIRRKGSHSEIPRMKLYLRKLLMQGQILMTRGLKDRPMSIFQNVIRQGKVYEQYDEILEALTYSQILVYNSKGLDAYIKVGKRMDFYELCRNYLYQAKKVHREYEAQILSTSSKIRLSQDQINNINKLEDYYEVTESANILSYYLLIKIEVTKSKSDYLSAYAHISRLLTILKKSKAIYSANRISFLNAELSNISLIKLDFQQALYQINESLEFRVREDLAGQSFKLRLITILCFDGQFIRALEECMLMESKRMVTKFSIVSSKLQYLMATASFGLKEYKEAQTILSQKNEIEKDKEGWNVWIRIMRILCSIELLKLNMIDYDVESFRKYLQRIDKQYKVRDRDKLVLRVLLELDKQDYDFEATSVKASKELEKLKSTDKKYAWNPDSPELILFHDWFEAKRLKRDYEPNFEVYREAMQKS